MWQRVIGILGGLGPYAHIELERRLLAAVESPAADAEFPEWIVASIPQTPDRTAALVENGPSPVPSLLRGLQRLATGADFAVISCITAHAFLDEIIPRSPLPILDLVALTMAEAGRRFAGGRIGVLATTGTLQSGVFSRAPVCGAAGLELVSLLDLAGGERLQEDLVMRPIYGPRRGSRRLSGGIKSGADRDPETGVPHGAVLGAAVRELADAGATCVMLGCTEIPIGLGRDWGEEIPLLDPLELAAREALRIARGEQPLP